MNIRKIMCGVKQRVFKFEASITKKDVAVLMFHEVCPLNEADNPSLSITFTSFKRVILAMKDDRMFSSIDGILTSNQKIAVITFDDAYANILVKAVPFLVDEKIPFAIFVCEELINQPNYLSSDDINYLKTIKLCSLQFHSRRHCFLSKLSKTNFINEISCDVFNKEFDLQCKYLAYPYGSVFASFRSDLNKVCKQYELAFSTVDSWFSFKYAKKHKYFLPRINISEDTINTFLKKMKIID